MAYSITAIDERFDRWQELLELIQTAFAYMEGRIDPPSSANRLTVAAFADQAEKGAIFIAEEAGDLVGCVISESRDEVLYVRKLAVRPDFQGRGIGSALLQATEALARALGLSALELQTRVELTENHAAFRKLRFVQTGISAHSGFDRPTSVTMRRRL